MWMALGVVAPFVGSFLAVLVIRLPEGRPVLIARSICESCGHSLGPSDLFPLASWLWLQGRCRYCGGHFGTFYPAIELAALAVVVWSATVTTGTTLVASCVLGWTLLTLALIDWRAYILPDPIVMVLLVAGLFVAWLLLDSSQTMDHLIGATAGFAVFVAIGSIYRAARNRDGLGLGDAKLLAALGAWLGWQGLPGVVLFAAILALTVVIGKSILGARLTLFDRLPFGPFLAVSGWLVWLYGIQI